MQIVTKCALIWISEKVFYVWWFNSSGSRAGISSRKFNLIGDWKIEYLDLKKQTVGGVKQAG